MLVKAGFIAGALSGSAGGITASHNKGGQYFRLRSIPTNPSSTKQQEVRAILASQSQGWADRTDAERNAWENWAQENTITNALGDSILMSGHQAYIKLNSRLDLDGDTLLTVPPIINAPAALESAVQAADIGVGAVDLTFTATPLPATVKLWMTAAVTNSPGISFIKNLLRFVGTSAAAETSPFDNQTLIEAVFGALIVGQTLTVRAATFDVATGLLSVPLESRAVVVSTV